MGVKQYSGLKRALSSNNSGLSSKRQADMVQMDTVERMRRQASDGRNGMRTQGKEEDKRVTSVAQKVCIQGSGGQ